jgi:hypothetical protein
MLRKKYFAHENEMQKPLIYKRAIFSDKVKYNIQYKVN